LNVLLVNKVLALRLNYLLEKKARLVNLLRKKRLRQLRSVPLMRLLQTKNCLMKKAQARFVSL
jgi:hypothetical protein